MKNKLIIFEGIDGCGKSTQLDYALKELTSKGYRVINTREPGGTPIGEEIRKLLKSGIPMSNETVAHLFASSRMEHNLQIKKWIQQGYIVICDRHFLSSYIYQGVELAVPINKYAMNILNDINYEIICFDVNYENYRNRISFRNKSSDRFEDKLNDVEYFNQIRSKYISTSKDYDAYIIDTNDRGEEDINEQVMEILSNIIEEE